MKELEKWYLWDKKTVVSGVTKAASRIGQIDDLYEDCPELGEEINDKVFYYAYTLGEKVASKKK